MNPFSSVASRLQSAQRQELAVQVLSKQEPISHLAAQEGVSPKFLYQQRDIAELALNKALEKEEPEKESSV